MVEKTAIHRMLKNRSWLHTYKLDELQVDLNEAGFDELSTEPDGIKPVLNLEGLNSRQPFVL